jgi:hypothetical protein
MEFHHQRLVLRADWSNGQRSSVAQLPVGDVLLRVRPNRKPWQLLFTKLQTVQNDSCIQRQDLSARRQKRININLFDLSLFSYQQAEMDEQIFEVFQIYRSPTPDALECRINTRLFHHSSS